MGIGRKPIVVVGSINLDLVAKAGHIPAAGETVHGSDFQIHPGGKGANQAVAVARFGYPVHMIGMLGSDALGEQLRSHLQGAGVGLDGVAHSDGASGVAMIVVDPHGENCIVATPVANAQVTPEYVDRYQDMIQNAGMVLTQLEIPVETVQHVADVCFLYNVPLMLDPAPAQTLPRAILKRIAWLHETEAAFYATYSSNGSGETGPRMMAHHLLALGPPGVLLKMRPRGAYVATKNVEEQINAIAVNAIDTTTGGCFQWSVRRRTDAWQRCHRKYALRRGGSGSIGHASRRTAFHARSPGRRTAPGISPIASSATFIRG